VGRDRLRNPHLQGVVVLDKPAGLTSQQAVSRVRASMRLDKLGHAGTLDPFATGVLPLLVNSATRVASLLTGDDKHYEGVMRLGVTTDTLDPTGKVLSEQSVDGVSESQVEDALMAYVGDIEQIPPMYSAVKIKGERLYKLARRNVEVERKPKPVVIHGVELISMDLPDVTFRVHCSAGTYVRVMVDEIGKTVGCGAHLYELVRLRSGNFRYEDRISLDRVDDLGTQLREEEAARHDPDAERRWRWPHEEATAWWHEQLGSALVPVTKAVGLPQLPLGKEAARRLRNGEPIRAGDLGQPAELSFAAGDQLLGGGDDGRTVAILKATCRGDLVARMEPRTPVLKVIRVLRTR
jgi:tRNA pseudouridine55 synthase